MLLLTLALHFSQHHTCTKSLQTRAYKMYAYYQKELTFGMEIWTLAKNVIKVTIIMKSWKTCASLFILFISDMQVSWLIGIGVYMGFYGALININIHNEMSRPSLHNINLWHHTNKATFMQSNPGDNTVPTRDFTIIYYERGTFVGSHDCKAAKHKHN